MGKRKKPKVGNLELHKALQSRRNETFTDRKKEARKKACRGKEK